MTDDINAASRKPLNKLWVYLVGVGLIGMYAAMFIPSLAGQRQEPMNGYYSMFWSWLFFYLLWKTRLKKGWQGGLIGLGVGFMAFFLAAFVGGYVRASGGSQ